VKAIDVDGFDNCVVTGRFGGRIDFGGGRSAEPVTKMSLWPSSGRISRTIFPYLAKKDISLFSF
jgi:hypothetical protein